MSRWMQRSMARWVLSKGFLVNLENELTTRLYRLILAALVAGSLVFNVTSLWVSRKDMAAGYGDFMIFYTGAQIINDGKSKELFKIATQDAYQAKFNVPHLNWPLPFNHAPYELLLFLPLVHFSYPVAHAIWSGVNLVLLISMLLWLMAYVQSPHRFFMAAAVLGWFPTMEAFRFGQDSILSTALLLAVLIALKRRRDGMAGFFLALGLYKPQLVLPMAGVFLVAQRWRGLAVFGITAAVLVFVSFAMVGFQGALDLLSILRSMEEYSFIINPRNMANVRGLSSLVLHLGHFELLVVPLTIALSLTLYGVCLYLWRQNFDVADAAFDLRYSLAMVTTVLISYHLYSHDLFLLALAVVLLFRYLSFHPASHWLVSVAFYFLLIILVLPVVPRYLIGLRAFGWGALPVLLLYLILVREIIHRQRLQAATA